MAGELITADGQIEWNGLLIGSGTQYKLHEVDGWDDSPGLDQGDVAKPSQHGSWGGQPLAEARVVTAQGSIRTGDIAAAIKALRAATPIRDDELTTTIVVRTPGGEMLRAEAKIDQRSIPTRPAASVGYARWALQWEMPDPRRYGLDQHVVEIAPPVAGSGMVWPIVWPLDWGTEGEPGGASIWNDGNAPANPLVLIPGPVVGPLVTNTTTGLMLEFDLTLGAGETLEIDTATGEVTLGGADRLYTATDVSAPVESWVLASGLNDITYTAFSFGAAPSMQIIYRDAHL